MKKKLINLLIVVSSITLLTSSYFLIKKYINQNNINEEQILINTIYENLNIEIETTGKKEILKHRKEFNNNDIVATLKISNLINSPIVQTNDNSYYLTHSLNKKRLPGGAVFIDYQTSINSKQINIYGHNSTRYDIPFKKLENYLNNNFTKENDIIYLNTLYDKRVYQVFSVSITPKTSKTEHYSFTYNNGSDWLEHFKRLKKNSFYNNDLDLIEEDEIIVLQTCLFNEYKNKLLVISAKRIH